jgi:hypothetical protein
VVAAGAGQARRAGDLPAEGARELPTRIDVAPGGDGGDGGEERQGEEGREADVLDAPACPLASRIPRS